MNAYLAIGHFKNNENVTCIAMQQTTKKDFMRDCYGNEFVPWVVITEKTFERLSKCDDELAAWEIVKKLTSNYRVWNDVADYIEQCFDLMTEKCKTLRRRAESLRHWEGGTEMKVYIVEVIPEASLGKVSQEGYTSLEKAQAFIESRADRPKRISAFIYRTDDFTDYLIYEVTVH